MECLVVKGQGEAPASWLDAGAPGASPGGDLLVGVSVSTRVSD